MQTECEAWCTTAPQVRNVHACQQGCRWMRFVAEQPVEHRLSFWQCGGLQQAQTCYELSEQVLRQCLDQVGSRLTFDMEAGIFHSLRLFQDACFDLSTIQGDEGYE